MQIEIPDYLLSESKLTKKDLLLEIALLLYQRNVFTLGQASKLAGIHQVEFQQEMKSHNIFLHYDLDDLKDDMKFVNEP